MSVMLPHQGRARQLQDLLRRELGIPDRCKAFSVRFATNKAVTVDCTYMPEERGEGPITWDDVSSAAERLRSGERGA